MPGLGLLLDIVIIALLGATIFYAIRLTRHLDAFRSNRSDMERLIRELSSQITRAQEGVTALDDAAKESGDELRDLVGRARGLSEELALMTEAGNSLAERLEGLATKNRSLVDELGASAVNLVTPGSKPYTPSLSAERKPVPTVASPREESPVKSFFSIRDPDFDIPSAEKDDDDFAASGLESQAERDLAAALKRHKLRDS